VDALNRVAVRFTECEDACEPTAEQIKAKKRERAGQFKSDQLLPIAGLGGAHPVLRLEWLTPSLCFRVRKRKKAA